MKKKLLIKALGYMLSVTMLLGSFPMPVMAGEPEISVIEIMDTKEGEDSETETVSDNSSDPAINQEEYPLMSRLELLDLDWKSTSNETLNHYLGMTEWNEIGRWLDSMSEEDMEEILARDTVLIQPTQITEADGNVFEMLYYEYALQVYGEEKGQLFAAYPLKTSGYWTTKIVKAGTAEKTATITHKISGVDTSKPTTERQAVTVAKSVAGNWCDVDFGTVEDSHKSYKGETADATYPYVRSNFSYVKPVGYTVSTTYSNTTSYYKMYWQHKITFNSSDSMFNSDGTISSCRHIYPNSTTCNNVSTAGLLDSSSSGKHNICSLINMYVNAGIGTTANETKGNLVQTITLTPISYNVNYNGNGATSGSVAAQNNCMYDQTYTTQGNGYSKEYTVTYNGNGGTPAVASQKSSYTFKNWNTLANGSGTNYAAAASYKNLTTTKNGAVTLYAQWNPVALKLPTASRIGYQFNGWNIGAAGAAYTPTADVTAMANWKANTYKIVLDNNNGSEKQTITAVYDQNVILPTPTRAGYTFTGWVGESGAYKDTVKNLTAVNGGTVNLTAAWEANGDTPYTVYYWHGKDENDPLRRAFGTEEGDKLPASEVFYGTTDTVVTVTAPDAGTNAEGRKYITPIPAPVYIKGDGSSEVHFYYELEDEDFVTYYVEHYIKKSPDGKYEKLETKDDRVEKGTVVTPQLSQKAIEAVNAVNGCCCKEPALQTVTVNEDGMVIKYYYDCVKKDSMSDLDINEIAKKLAAGLSFSMEIDGATYEIVQNPDGTLGIKFTSTDATKVVIPDVIKIGDKVYRITEIYEKAFKDNTTIKEVEFSANISKIGDAAFEGCTNLEKVTLRDGLVTIGNKAFNGCSSLKTINLPATVQKIGDYAFQNCTSLKTVTLNNGLVTIGKKAFYNCTALTKIKIPYTVIKIGSYAFGKCKKLKSLKFGEESRLLSIGYGGFSNCVSLTSVKLPDKLTKITKKTFYNCKKLNTVKIGKSVTSIGIESFKNCSKLKKVSGGSKVNVIYQNAFQNCKTMTKYTITSRVQKIGDKAFYNCKQLKTVTIKSKALTSVGKAAFKKCKKNITFKVPDSKISSYSQLLKGKY